MKLIFQIFIFFLFANYAFAQDIVFSDLQELPEGRSSIHSATDGQNIYVVNGFTTTLPYSAEIIKYNIASDTWSTIYNNTIAKRYASSAVVNGKLYIFNGVVSGGAINDQVEVIDLTDNTLSLSTPNPTPGRAAGAAEWEGKIYSFGGFTAPGVYSNKLSSFDPATETWNALADMPVATETKGEIVNGKLYVFGGYNGTALTQIISYDIATDTWETIGTMPNSISAHAATVIGSKIWLAGDFTNLTSLAYFDTEDNSFHVVNSNMNSRRHAAAEGIDNQLIIIGGNTASNIISSITSVQVGDIVSSDEKVLLDNRFKVYPNPTAAILFFEKEIEQLQIFDASGKVVKYFLEKKESVNVEDLKAGNYLIIGESEGKRYSASWVKM